MGWETSLTLAFLGASFIIVYIANSIKDDETNNRWSRVVPFGLRTILYFISFGLLLFPIGAQTHIMFLNGIYTNSSLVETNTTESLLAHTVDGGVSVIGKSFYLMIVIVIILVTVMIVERMLLKKRKGGGEDYERY